MKIESIIFDLDGTLVDTFPGIERAALLAIRSMMPNVDAPKLRGLIGPPIREIFSVVLPNVGPDELDELEAKFRVSYNSEGWKDSVAYRGISDALVGLSAMGVQNFVVTNKPRVPTEKILKHLGLTPYLKGCISPDSVQPPFASKEAAVSHIIRAYDLNPQETLLVGDSSDDARAARECGLRFGAVSYGYGSAHQECEYPIYRMVSEPSELLGMVHEASPE